MWTFIKHLVRGQLLKAEKAIKQGEPREEWEIKCASFFFPFFFLKYLETTPCVCSGLPFRSQHRYADVMRWEGAQVLGMSIWKRSRTSQCCRRRRAAMGKYVCLVQIIKVDGWHQITLERTSFPSKRKYFGESEAATSQPVPDHKLSGQITWQTLPFKTAFREPLKSQNWA